VMAYGLQAHLEIPFRNGENAVSVHCCYQTWGTEHLADALDPRVDDARNAEYADREAYGVVWTHVLAPCPALESFRDTFAEPIP
jgi:hypothetical protein